MCSSELRKYNLVANRPQNSVKCATTWISCSHVNQGLLEWYVMLIRSDGNGRQVESHQPTVYTCLSHHNAACLENSLSGKKENPIFICQFSLHRLSWNRLKIRCSTFCYLLVPEFKTIHHGFTWHNPCLLMLSASFGLPRHIWQISNGSRFLLWSISKTFPLHAAWPSYLDHIRHCHMKSNLWLLKCGHENATFVNLSPSLGVTMPLAATSPLLNHISSIAG